MGLGVVTLITGLLGCATAKFKKPWFAILFILLTFVLGCTLLIVGALATFGGAIYDKAAGVACAADSSYSMYKDAVDQRLCTDQCRCNEEYKTLWESQQDEMRELGQFERAGRDMNSFKWTSNQDEIFEDWLSCYEAKMKDSWDSNSNQARFIEQGGFEFVKGFEDEFDCGGVCEVPLFYMSRPISDGPPTKGCVEAAAKGMAGKLGTTGVVALITGIMMLIGMIGACPLCTGFSEEK